MPLTKHTFTRSFIILDNKHRLKLKFKLMTLYSKLKLLFFYSLKRQDISLLMEEYDALEKLASNPTLIICKSDKCNGEVVMNKDDYISKMNKILSNKTQFQKVSVDDNYCQLNQISMISLQPKKKGNFSKKKFTIELDPSQLLLLHFMVCQNCPKKDTYVSLS